MTGMHYFHGGRPGLAPGDEILPPSETSAVTWGDILRETDPGWWRARGGGTAGEARRNRVYAGTAQVAARFGAMWTLNQCMEGNGAIYEVRPIGKVEPDPFPNLPGHDEDCWMCPRAAVTKVINPSVHCDRLLKDSPHWRELARSMREAAKLRAEGRQLKKHAFMELRNAERWLRAATGGALLGAAGTDVWAIALKALGL